MSVARFIADQRTFYRVPHAVTCAILGVSVSWFYKWVDRGPTDRQRRRAELDARVRELFDASGSTYGSPRIHADLLAEGWRVGVNTVADSMRRQGLQGRKPKRRKGLTKQDKHAAKFPDLLKRDFTAAGAESQVVWRYHRDPAPTRASSIYKLRGIRRRVGRQGLVRRLASRHAGVGGVEMAGAWAARPGRGVVADLD